MEKLEDYFYEQLDKAKSILDELDEIGSQCSVEQSKVDQELSDWLHMIQHEDLDDNEFIKVGKKIKELRIKREHLNNLWDLCKIFNEERCRLADPGNRIFLMNKMRSKYNNFNKEYNNRILTNDTINETLNNTRKKRTKVDSVLIIQMFNDGKSVKEIAKELGCATITIYKHLKKGE